MNNETQGLTSLPDKSLEGIAGGKLSGQDKLYLERLVDRALARGYTFEQMLEEFGPSIEEHGIDIGEAADYMHSSFNTL